MIRALIISAVCGLSVVGSGYAQTDVLFLDDFDTETYQWNVTELQHWKVANPNGSVDVVNFAPCKVQCIDLDGSTSEAAVLQSEPIPLPAGDYILDFDLAGSQRGDTNQVEVFLGAEPLGWVRMQSYAPLRTFSRFIATEDASDPSVWFAHSGGDAYGLLLDRVKLSRAASAPDLKLVGSYKLARIAVTCRNVTTGQAIEARIRRVTARHVEWNCLPDPYSPSDELYLRKGDLFKVEISGTGTRTRGSAEVSGAVRLTSRERQYTVTCDPSFGDPEVTTLSSHSTWDCLRMGSSGSGEFSVLIEGRV